MAEKAKNYAELATELDAIIEWFESEYADLDEAMSKYEEAAKIISQMEKYLLAAENKIKKISAGF